MPLPNFANSGLVVRPTKRQDVATPLRRALAEALRQISDGRAGFTSG
jgi:hypothetical protein